MSANRIVTHLPDTAASALVCEAIRRYEHALDRYRRARASALKTPDDERRVDEVGQGLLAADMRLAQAIREAAGVDAGVLATAVHRGVRYAALPLDPCGLLPEFHVAFGPAASVVV